LNQRPEVASRWLNPNYFYFSAVTTWGTLCHLPGRRFHVALDFNPSSKGRAAVFARYDSLIGQCIGKVEPTPAFSAFETSVRDSIG
jgi:hypothetical protein